MRDDLLATIRARVQRMADTGDLSAVEDPRAVTDARRLAETMAEADLVEVRIVLGWWHWFRYRASSARTDDREIAVRLLMPCFLAEAGPLPEPLLPLIAMAAEEPAVGLLGQSLDSPGLELVSAVFRLWGRMVTAIPADHPRQCLYLTFLSTLAMARFERSQDRVDLDVAIDVSRSALEAAAVHDHSNPRYLYDYGQFVLRRFDLSGDQRDLTQAVTCVARALEIGARDQLRPLALFELGRALRRHFMATNARKDLDLAISALETALSGAISDEDYWSACVWEFGAALVIRYERWGDPADLDLAIDSLERAIEKTLAVPWRAILALALLARFERTGEHADLSRADALSELGPDFVAENSGDGERLSLRGRALAARFEETGDLADLNAALDAHRRAVGAPGPPEIHRLSACASALRMRYDTTGDLPDLNEAIVMHRQALDMNADLQGHDLAIFQSNLGNALHARFERTGRVADLNEAVGMHRQAVAGMTPDHSRWGMVNSNLGNALARRHAVAGAEDDLPHAIEALRAAVAATPAGHRDRGMYLSNLGSALLQQHQRGCDQTTLSEAGARLREAVAALPPDHPLQVAVQFNLGQALRAGLPDSGGEAQRDAAVATFTRAAETGTGAYLWRIRAFEAAARLAVQSDPSRAADLLEAAVLLLPRLVPRQLGRQDQQHLLSEFARMMNDAAALALANPARDPGRALQLLETGRAVLFSQGLDIRVDLNLLGARAPDLAARFTELSDRLGEPAIPLGAGAPRTGSGDRHRIAAELSETVDAIRRLDGFASFVAPPSVPELLHEAGQGPIVVFNVSFYRSDALLVTPDGVDALPLPGLQAEATFEKIAEFYTALIGAYDPDADLRSRRDAETAVGGVLEWLWQVASEPVLEALGLVNIPGPGDTWPRVWWATGGILGMLPIHASGRPGSGPDAVMQRVVSSYIPTVRALQYARRRTIPPDRQDGQALIVAMTAPGTSALRHAAEEAAAVQAWVPRSTLLAPGGAHTPTRENVLAGVATHPIAHFACHAIVDVADLFRSMLLLQDYSTDPLTVESLSPLRLDHAELAYLSACSTATGPSERMHDEAIHLATAFQLAGFRNVIGTLWDIHDKLAVTVTDSFYRGLRANTGEIDTGQAAVALHHAIRAQRSRFPQNPSLWAAHVHIGA